MRSIILTVLALFSYVTVLAQAGAIEGEIIDKESGEAIPFANVRIYSGGSMQGGTTTNMNGEYSIKPVDPGKYDLKVTYVGYQPKKITDVVVTADKTVFVNVKISKGVKLEEVEVKGYKKPLFQKDQAKVQQTMTADEVEKLPQRDVSDIASASAGVFQRSEGSGLNFRGSRTDANQVYIDGIKIRGSDALPQSAIEQMSTVTGGVPAKYGDATGGIINITTKGASKEFNGGLEAQTSKFLDPYNYNLIGGNVSGPIITEQVEGEEDEEDRERAVLGFFVAGEYKYRKDPKPPYYSVYSVKDKVLDSLEKYPLRRNPNGSGLVRSAEFVSQDRFIGKDGEVVEDPLRKTPYRRNVRRHDLSLSSKIDYSPTDLIDVTLGGQLSYSDFNEYVRSYSLFNPSGNPRNQLLDWRVFGRFTQRFQTGGKQEEDGEEGGAATSVIKDAFYSVQLDYSRVNKKEYNPIHGTNFFRYGHVGKFKTEYQPSFAPGVDTATGNQSNYVMEDINPSRIDFEPSSHNPLAARYTEQYYDILGTPASKNSIEGRNALTNGIRPANIYSLWYNTGRQYNGYGIDKDNTQLRFSINGSVDLDISGSEEKSNVHQIEFGIEYEQRTDREYQISPVGLWDHMRQLANEQIESLDKSDPTLIIDGKKYEHDEPHPAFGVNDSIIYDRKYVASDHNYFDKQLRKKLGMSLKSKNLIDVDSLSPSEYSMDMFSADEILNDGNRFALYRGYDHTGDRLKDQPSFNDFFTEKTEDGVYTRPVGAFRPIYVAGYVQDKFTFKDLIFNVGLRVDRYDANTKVLKDKYSLYDINTVAEVDELAGESVTHPGNIGNDYKVYVDDIQDPEEVVGYRKGDTWYDVNGEEVNDPEVIEQATTKGEIQPYLVNPDVSIKDEEFNPDNSFKDYEPQVSVMPRIAFSFPISDEATFFAHYDVKTQRPQGRNIATPYHYYFLEERSTQRTPNPNLKPEKTIDYEVGFKQKLSRSSALSISGFYKELRDMIQLNRVRYAYPTDYVSFSNIDFGNVKGMTFSYDLRRTNNIQLLTNYTLQFAKGTGSNKTAQSSLVNTENPNVRFLIPLDYDQRHSITTVLDYRFKGGSEYDGPRWFGKKIFADAGANLRIEAGSGVPYTQYSAPTRAPQIGVAGRANLEGDPNGSRLPWSVRTDLRLDKNFDINIGGGEEDAGSSLGLNVYLKVENLLNNRNTLRVYSYTGSPSDDGFLTSAKGQQITKQQLDPQSFRDLYAIKMRNYVLGGGNPHYGMPRRIRLGAIVNF